MAWCKDSDVPSPFSSIAIAIVTTKPNRRSGAYLLSPVGIPRVIAIRETPSPGSAPPSQSRKMA